MTVHKQEDGTCVISASGIWLPGCYEDKRAARFAFRVDDEVKQELEHASYFTGSQVITWQDIKDYKARYL